MKEIKIMLSNIFTSRQNLQPIIAIYIYIVKTLEFDHYCD